MAYKKPNTPPSKPWWKSKTIWFNTLATIAGGVEVVAQNLPVLQAVLPPGTGAALAVVVPVANVILRAVTKSAIHGGQTQQPPAAEG